jgi:response regulator of citrate/malate metabolism
MTAIYKHTRYQNEAKLKYGVDDYLIKPVLPESLAGLVRRTQAGAMSTHQVSLRDSLPTAAIRR